MVKWTILDPFICLKVKFIQNNILTLDSFVYHNLNKKLVCIAK